YFNPPSSVVSSVLPVAAPLPADTTGRPSLTTIDQDAPFVSTSSTTHEIQAPVIHQDLSSEESSSRDVIPSNLHQLNQSFDNLRNWSKDHPLAMSLAILLDLHELALEQSQQGASNDVCDDGNPASANIKQVLEKSALRRSDNKNMLKYGDPNASTLRKANITSWKSCHGVKDCQGRLLKSFQDEEKYEHVGPKTQDHKMAKDFKIIKRCCMDDDLKEAQDHKQVNHEGTSSRLMIKKHYIKI
ncbi:hypothetical protein Tco_0039897, partial [Tanacetum coccineum]